MGTAMRRGPSALGLLLAALIVVHHTCDAAPLSSDVQILGDDEDQDLGEAAMESDSEEAQVGAEVMYAATKKKLQAKIKKAEKTLKKKKAAAKKHFDKSMKKASKVFGKLYAPIKSGPTPKLNSPLGDEGQSGISSMARWAYATAVQTATKIAHKKIAKYEKELEENRFAHFSTAVCKEVLKSKVRAIGDMQYKKKKAEIKQRMKKLKVDLNKRLAFDKADMQHKIASFKLWKTNSQFAVDGGITGPDPKKTHMMTAGQENKMAASRVGELSQAAHWAYARQKSHALSFFDRNIKMLKKQLMKAQKQHDLTLCRTGRKPNSPQLKFELKRAKNKLKKEMATPAAKSKKKGGKKKKKGEEQEEYGDLGESSSIDDSEDEFSATDDTAVQFHNLVDSSGGDQSFADRVKMFKDLE